MATIFFRFCEKFFSQSQSEELDFLSKKTIEGGKIVIILKKWIPTHKIPAVLNTSANQVHHTIWQISGLKNTYFFPLIFDPQQPNKHYN
jgi:hypothetical protein